MGYDFVATYTGREMNLLKPKVEDVSIYDIAYTLSHINRWNGTTLFTVAQHSLLVADLVALSGGSVREQLLGLMHDGAEAYIGDMPKPIKDKIEQSQFMESERLIEDVIRKYVGLAEFDTMLIDIVKKADRLACEIEAYLFKKSTEHWDIPKPKELSLIGMPCIENADIVESKFIARYNKLKYNKIIKGLPIWDKGITIGELIGDYIKTDIGVIELKTNVNNIVSLKRLIYEES